MATKALSIDGQDRSTGRRTFGRAAAAAEHRAPSCVAVEAECFVHAPVKGSASRFRQWAANAVSVMCGFSPLGANTGCAAMREKDSAGCASHPDAFAHATRPSFRFR